MMAMAVQKLYPDAKVTIGPWIENGFYYDFDTEPLTDKDLKRSKKEMVSRNSPLNIFYVWGLFYFSFHASQENYALRSVLRECICNVTCCMQD